MYVCCIQIYTQTCMKKAQKRWKMKRKKYNRIHTHLLTQKIRWENSGSYNNKNARPRSDSYAIRIIIFCYFATAICYRNSSYRLQSHSLILTQWAASTRFPFECKNEKKNEQKTHTTQHHRICYKLTTRIRMIRKVQRRKYTIQQQQKKKSNNTI